MSVITQDGDSALMIAAREGRTEVVSLLLKAGANIQLQNEVMLIAFSSQVSMTFSLARNNGY